MTLYEKIVILLIAFNFVSYFAFLRPHALEILMSLKTERYTFLAIWYVIWFWSSPILFMLWIINLVWSM